MITIHKNYEIAHTISGSAFPHMVENTCSSEAYTLSKTQDLEYKYSWNMSVRLCKGKINISFIQFVLAFKRKILLRMADKEHPALVFMEIDAL